MPKEPTAAASEREPTTSSRREIDSDGLFALSIDMLCVADMEGFFQRVNPAFEKTLGWTADELLAQPFTDFVHPDDRQGTAEAMGVLAQGEHVIDFENRYRHRDGSYRWFQWRAVPSGDVVYAVARDVTEARHQAEERRKLEERMRQAQKLESLGLLAGGIAHDFNNLLSGILGLTELALLQMSPTSPVHEEIKMIETAAVRASELCQQMLAYSGKGQFVITRFRLSDLVEEMAQLLKVSISKQVHLHLDIARNMPEVEGDVSQIRQVVMNLITNASEACADAGGEIQITTGVTEAQEADLAGSPFEGALRPGPHAFLEVRDEGPGMDETTLARIFDPFFTTKFTGRGLGLAAVLGIVRGHRGAIQVSSEVGNGTRFRIFLPTQESAVQEAEAESLETPYQGFGKIILADDDARVRTVTARLLRHLGFEVLTAMDGIECLDLFDQEPAEIRLVVLDLTMPRMDGKGALRELRARSRDLPILMTSGYSSPPTPLESASDPSLLFLKKPFRLRALEQKLREILPGPQDLDTSSPNSGTS